MALLQQNARRVAASSRRMLSTVSQSPSDPFSTASFLTTVSHTSPRLPDFGGVPEIVVAGRANSGKSSLLNALLGREKEKLVKTSSKAGKTRELNFFQVGKDDEGKPRLILVDAPGYGARGRPEWGELFDRYLNERKELRRVYMLFSTTHTPLNTADKDMLSYLSELCISPPAGDAEEPSPSAGQRWSLQSIITKADAPSSTADLREAVKGVKQGLIGSMCLPPIMTSVKMRGGGGFGIDDVKRNVLVACGLTSDMV